jgi:hypothetical protein
VNPFYKTIIGKPEKWLVDAAAVVGLDYSELSHEITNHFMNHVINRHGDPKKHGASTITYADFELLSAIVKKPNIAIIGAKRWELFYNIYIKIENEMTWFYFDHVLDSKRNRTLRSDTLYKVTRQLTLDEIIRNITRNDKTDISKANILTIP